MKLMGRRRVAESSAPEADRDEVARVAYELYLQRGQADGHDLGDWLKAEVLVRQRRRAQPPRSAVW